MAIAKQMELFEDGGLMQEGGQVDEQSGNEVPIGSTKEEVRDDIPAQLSEGEFVMPADAVRYHGLDKMMALRQEAKLGLQRMEQMGMMGNSDEATLPDDIPFDINDIDMEDEPMEFQVGGMVPSPQAQAAGIASYQPSMFQNLPTTGPVAPPAPPQVPAPPPPAPAQAFVPQMKVPEQLPTFQQVAQPTYATYVNDLGQELQIPVDANGNPLIPVPAGYKKKSEQQQDTTDTTTAAPTQPTPTAATETGDGGDSDMPSAPKSAMDIKVESVYNTPEYKEINSLLDTRTGGEKFGDAIKGLFGKTLIGSILGAEDTTQEEYDKAKRQLAVDIANYSDDPAQQKQLMKEIASNLKDETPREGKAPVTGGYIRNPDGTIKRDPVTGEMLTYGDKPSTAKVETTLGKTAVTEAAQTAQPETVTEAAKPDMPTGFGLDVQTGQEKTLVKNAYDVLTGSNNPEERAEALTQLATMVGNGYANPPEGQVSFAKIAYQGMVSNGSITEEEAKRGNSIIESLTTSREKPAQQEPKGIEDLIGRAAAASTRKESVEQKIAKEMGAGSGYNRQYEKDIKAGKYDSAFNARDRFDRDVLAEIQRSERQEISKAKSEGRKATFESRPAGQGEVSDSRGNVIRDSNGNPVKTQSTTSAKGRALAAEREQREAENSVDSRVICTELYRQGKLNKELYRMDVVYTARHLSPTVVKGYHYWAIPTVQKMRNSTALTNFMLYFTLKRAEEIAHIVNPAKYPKTSITGKIIKNVGEALCYGIGLFVNNSDYKVLYKGEKTC